MRIGSPDIDPLCMPARRRWLPLALAALLLGVLLVAASPAPAVQLQKKLKRSEAALSKVKGEQDDLEAAIQADNARVDDLIAQLAATRQRAMAVREKLNAEQAKLEQATRALGAGHRRLAELRAHLRKAMGTLGEELVSIYKTGDAQTVDLVLGSSNWSDLAARSEYLGAVQDYRDSVTTRVRDLRDQAHAEVVRLAEARDRTQAARDAVAAREERISAMRTSMQGQHDALLAAQAERQGRIDELQSREQSIQGNLGHITSKIQAKAAAVASQASIPVPTPTESVAPPASGQTATLLSNGQAVAPAGAPPAVVAAIAAANSIATTPYIWGGGHGSFDSSGYDCSGAVSFALHGGGLLDSPLDSTGLETWGEDGPGSWISIYANSGHVWSIIAGLRWDTAANTGSDGPRWSTDISAESTSGYIVRHYPGY